MVAAPRSLHYPTWTLHLLEALELQPRPRISRATCYRLNQGFPCGAPPAIRAGPPRALPRAALNFLPFVRARRRDAIRTLTARDPTSERFPAARLAARIHRRTRSRSRRRVQAEARE